MTERPPVDMALLLRLLRSGRKIRLEHFLPLDEQKLLFEHRKAKAEKLSSTAQS